MFEFERKSYLYTCSAEKPKSAGNGHNVPLVLRFHLRQKGLGHLLVVDEKQISDQRFRMGNDAYRLVKSVCLFVNSSLF